MIDPDRCVRITGTAARIPFTAPRTFTRNDRSQSSVARLWMRPLGASTPALLMSTSSRPNRSTARPTTASTSAPSPTAAGSAPTAPRSSGRPCTVASSAASLTSLRTTSVSGSPANRRESSAPRVAPAPVIATTRRCAGSLMTSRSRRFARGRSGPAPLRAGIPASRPLRSYEEVPAVDVEHGAGDERRGVGGEELVRTDQIRGCPPPPERGVGEHTRPELGMVLPRLHQRRVEPTGGDHVHRDAVGGEIERERLRQADHRRLRRAVRRQPLTRSLTEDGPREDQASAVAHDTGGGACTEERAGEGHVDDLPPHRRPRLTRTRDDRLDPRVADPHVDATQSGHGRVGHRLVEVLVGHVAG